MTTIDIGIEPRTPAQAVGGRAWLRNPPRSRRPIRDRASHVASRKRSRLRDLRDCAVDPRSREHSHVEQAALAGERAELLGDQLEALAETCVLALEVVGTELVVCERRRCARRSPRRATCGSRWRSATRGGSRSVCARGAGGGTRRPARHARPRAARRGACVDRAGRRPLVEPYVALAEGAVALLSGRWRDSFARCDPAERVFRDDSVGAAWDVRDELTSARRCVEDRSAKRKIFAGLSAGAAFCVTAVQPPRLPP